jgi:hypothetical protein
LRADSKFYKQRFEFDGSQRGWAVIFALSTRRLKLMTRTSS